MYKNIKLPAPQLSELKEVNVDLDMTGRHYAWIATANEKQVPEDIAVQILTDLMKEDPNKLTIAELRYIFTLVKITSLEDDYSYTVKCKCGCENKFDLHLSDSDLHLTPGDYKVPELKFTTYKPNQENVPYKEKETEEDTYYIKPPLMDMESALNNWFLVEKSKTWDDIVKDPAVSMDYSFLHAAMHLVKRDGRRLISTMNEFEDALKLLDCNKLPIITKLFEMANEVDSFGVQNPYYVFKCKECGGEIEATLPFFYGIN